MLDKLEPEVQSFVEELLVEGNLTDDEKKFLQSLVHKDEVHNKFKAGIHGNRRFNQELDKTKAERKKFEDEYSRKIEELESLRESLSAGSDLSRKEIDTLKSQIRAKEDQIHRAIQKAKEFEDGEKVLEELGLSSTSPYITPSPSPTPTPTSGAYNEDEILKKLGNQMNVNARALAKWAVDLRKMEREYFSLTGKEIDPEELFNKLSEKVDSYGGNYYKAFEDEYNIPELRNEQHTKALRAEIEKEMEAKYERKLADKLLPSDQRPVADSDFYKSIESTVPKEEGITPSTNPMGIDNRSAVVGEAAAFMQKLREKKEATA